MALFDIPEGYSCVVRQNDTTLYAYAGNHRHVYVVNGLNWEHTSTQINSTIPTNSVCVTSRQYPSSVVDAFVLGGIAFAILTFAMIFKLMKRSFL